MWNLRNKKTRDCSRFRDALENAPDVSALAAELKQHLAPCEECRLMADEFTASRALLGALPSQRFEPSSWFAGRVMSVIGAREGELRRSIDTWSLIPRLAAQLAWVSAVALLLAGTWLYERPRFMPHATEASAGESLFESPSPAAPDDLLTSVVERD
jgi:hypothetical protein